ncbi:MAG: tetratricopeptide repeat protein [Planctomycetia bacterium]|nr:tetratricopeptide repeat protein [Planctomycetia bacterium]
MNSIQLIRKKWFLVTFSLCYLGILWTSFQWVYHKELLLQNLYKSNTPPESGQVMKLYSTMMKSVPKSNEFNSFYRLAKILARAEKRKESIKVLNRIIRIAPEDREVRLWLAIELYNQKRYREAEKHFVVLLKKNTKDSPQKYAEYH